MNAIPLTDLKPLTRAITNAISQAGAGGGGAFDPAAAFAGGVPGFAVDTMTPAKLFQDSARTVPVIAIGDPIGGPLDVSPNAKHPVQATGANRPLWDGQGALFDGSNDGWATPAIDFTGTDKVTVMFGIVKNVDVATQIVVELTATAVSNNGAFFVAGALASFSAGLRGTAFLARTFGPFQQSNVGIVKVEFDLSQAAAADEITNTINGVVRASSTSSGTNAGTGNFANAVVYIGRRAGTTFPLSGTIFRPVVIGKATSEAEDDAYAEWIAEAVNQRAAFSDTPTVFADSATPTEQSGYQLTSPFAHVEYTTEATVLDVDVFTDYAFDSLVGIGVLVDGVFLRNLAPQGLGATRHRIYLPAGAKTISIVNGIQSRVNPAAPIQGVFMKAIYADKALTRVSPPTPTNRVLIYGDSISVGGNALPTVQNAWAMQVRAAAGSRSICVEGYGYRSLYEDAATSGQRAALVAKLVAYAPETIWLAIGTNDYGLNLWGAASFGTAYAALLDDLHAALPSVVIYCQTPLLRAVETANSFGSTTGDYRTQISNAVSTRTAYATLIDGTAIMTTGSLADGVHPNTAGHAIYATYVRGVLGI